MSVCVLIYVAFVLAGMVAATYVVNDICDAVSDWWSHSILNLSLGKSKAEYAREKSDLADFIHGLKEEKRQAILAEEIQHEIEQQNLADAESDLKYREKMDAYYAKFDYF